MYTNINSPKSMVNNTILSKNSSFARVIEVPDCLPTYSIDKELAEIENYRNGVISAQRVNQKKQKNIFGKALFILAAIGTFILVKMKLK